MLELFVGIGLICFALTIMSAVDRVVGDEFLQFVAEWEKKRKGH